MVLSKVERIEIKLAGKLTDHAECCMNGTTRWDVLILGAGAAGLICAGEAGRRGRRVLVVDHAAEPGMKIRISGDGHCNITNRNLGKEHYLSEHPGFCVSALRQFGAEAVLQRLVAAAIAVEEREGGQYFCVGSARQVVACAPALGRMLLWLQLFCAFTLDGWL